MCGAGRTYRCRQALLGKGAPVNAQDGEGRTALMFAIINLHVATVKVLLDGGADVNGKAKDRCTALMLAASSGDHEIVRVLLDRGADPSGRFDQTGIMASMLAARNGLTDIVELLREVEKRQSRTQSDEILQSSKDEQDLGERA